MISSGRHLWQKHPATGEPTFGEKSADVLKHGFGTWFALFTVLGIIAVWVTFQNTPLKWDNYPFILLNLCLSCMAAVQGIVLQISANRGDKVSAEVALHTAENTENLVRINKIQLELLREIHRLQGQVNNVLTTDALLAMRLERLEQQAGDIHDNDVRFDSDRPDPA